MKLRTFISIHLIFLLLAALGQAEKVGPAPPATVSERLKYRSAHRAFAAFSAGYYVNASELYRAALAQANRRNDNYSAAKFLSNLGACQLAVFQYQDALKSFEEGRIRAVQAAEPSVLASLDANIAALLLQMGHADGAIATAERGLGLVPKSAAATRTKLLFQLGRAYASRDDLARAEKVFSETVDAAYETADPDMAAWAWNNIGNEYRLAGALDRADVALSEAFRLRRVFGTSGISGPAWSLAMLRSSQGNLPAARVLMDLAIEGLHTQGNMTAPWNVYSDKGQIEIEAGNVAPGLDYLREALEMARTWRAGVIDTDSSRTTTEGGLSRLFNSFVEAGNERALRTGELALAHETFDAAEENRAFSLRALVPQPNDWRNRLPADFRELLHRFQTAEQVLLSSDTPVNRAAAAALRGELDRKEAALRTSVEQDSTHALERAQKVLDSRSALFSFHLGGKHSWLWVVAHDRFQLYALPGKGQLTEEIREFSQDMQSGGTKLYRSLFGMVSPDLLGKERWLLALDEDLFTVPFPALPVENGDYLGKKHSLQITSGALLLGARQEDGSGAFLGVGDPVYNRADARWVGSANTGGLPAGGTGENRFARLWGTGEEVRLSAEAWGASDMILLTGRSATRSKLWEQAARQPSVIHFATHILDAQRTLQTGWIALSIGADGQPEFLSPAEISSHVVKARLVVLSGCGSGAAEVRSASGLMGLTRAWMAAGATSVLATRWPVMDDNGVFLSDFYRHWRKDGRGGPAAALRMAQEDSIRMGDWHARPAFWASYFLVGNH